ncbi:ABC transporter permease [Calidithermus roseus]|uniref:Putative multiple-sugar transport system permease YteP n=1 Tax=Calidithermus roseus TaxID=1644118 RepID=A0A399EPJ1_9DEIN|nr:ABC transporter permease subunit [Calidithermus roseus]RIH84959.1 putative multiple-sugar transport system permease YteP [Calidithermus roseus]
MNPAYPSKPAPQWRQSLKHLARSVWRHRVLYLMLLPGLLYFLIFRYWPLWNAQIAFRDFQPTLGVWGSPWVGLQHFLEFFNSYYFSQLLVNTLVISVAKIALGIPPAILLAIALHETSRRFLSRAVQTMSYLPHFLSWVIVYGILLAMLSPSEGLINSGLRALGLEPVPFLTSTATFQPVVVLSEVWKETGWSAILFLAALLSINPALYEAAAIDGASRWQQVRHISLPGIVDVLVLVVLLKIGSILDAGFHQIFVLYSLPVYSVGDIIDTWVYRQGIQNFQFSLATAVGLFKGVIGLVLIVVANRLARRFVGTGLY